MMAVFSPPEGSETAQHCCKGYLKGKGLKPGWEQRRLGKCASQPEGNRASLEVIGVAGPLSTPRDLERCLLPWAINPAALPVSGHAQYYFWDRLNTYSTPRTLLNISGLSVPVSR